MYENYKTNKFYRIKFYKSGKYKNATIPPYVVTLENSSQ